MKGWFVGRNLTLESLDLASRPNPFQIFTSFFSLISAALPLLFDLFSRLIYKTSDVTITQQFFQQQQYIQSGTNTKQQIITSSQSEIANVSMGVSSTVVSMSQNNVKVSSAGEALNLGSGMSTYPFTIIIL